MNVIHFGQAREVTCLELREREMCVCVQITVSMSSHFVKERFEQCSLLCRIIELYSTKKLGVTFPFVNFNWY